MKHLFRSILCGLFLFAGTAIAGPVNVNTADAETLAVELVGVGKVTAAAIVGYREEHGPFKSLEDFRNVKGIGEKLIEKNVDNIRFSD